MQIISTPRIYCTSKKSGTKGRLGVGSEGNEGGGNIISRLIVSYLVITTLSILVNLIIGTQKIADPDPQHWNKERFEKNVVDCRISFYISFMKDCDA